MVCKKERRSEGKWEEKGNEEEEKEMEDKRQGKLQEARK